MTSIRSAILSLLACSTALGVPAAPPASPVPAAEPDAAATPTPAPKQTPAPFIILNAKLEPEPVQILKFTSAADGSGEITTRDAAGATRTRPLSQVLALVPGAWGPGADPDAHADSASPRHTPILELVDGQRWPGFILIESPGTAHPADVPVRWGHDRLGALSIAVDAVRRYSSGRDRQSDPPTPSPAFRPPTPPASSTDWVALLNGDRISGVVEQMGQNIRIMPHERGSAPIEVDTTQVTEIYLSNPPAIPKGPTVWLADGTVVRVSSLTSLSRAQMRVEAASTEPGAATVDQSDSEHATPRNLYNQADLLAFAPDTSRLTALAVLSPESFSPVKPLIYAEPLQIIAPASGASALGADDVLLPGPMSVQWRLPTGARRLSLTAALADDTAAWSQCILKVLIAGRDSQKELARVELDHTRRAQPLNIDLSGAVTGDKLLLVLEPGERGPIQDAVLLKHAIFAISPPAK